MKLFACLVPLPGMNGAKTREYFTIYYFRRTKLFTEARRATAGADAALAAVPPAEVRAWRQHGSGPRLISDTRVIDIRRIVDTHLPADLPMIEQRAQGAQHLMVSSEPSYQRMGLILP